MTTKQIQEFLPGQEPVKNPKIHKAALKYASLRDARMEAGTEEKQAELNLLAIMDSEGVENYEYGDLKVFLRKDRKVRVKIGGTEEESPNGEE